MVKLIITLFITLFLVSCAVESSKMPLTPMRVASEESLVQEKVTLTTKNIGQIEPLHDLEPSREVEPTEAPAPAPTNTPSLPQASYPSPLENSEVDPADLVPPSKLDLASGYPAQSSSEATLPVWGYEVLNAFPHDPEAYTQGLVISSQGDEFIEGTGLWGQSSLRRVDIESGDVTQFVALQDQYFGEGITLFEDQIYQLTWKSSTGFIYDSESFDLNGQFYYPHEGWGLTHDGRQLIVSDGTATIHFWDPETFDETRQIQVTDPNGPIFLLNELEYVDGEIWANIWFSDLIARISPEDGEVLGWIDLTGLYEAADRGTQDVLNGIAYDYQTGRLFVTGKRWPAIFEIELVKNQP